MTVIGKRKEVVSTALGWLLSNTRAYSYKSEHCKALVLDCGKIDNLYKIKNNNNISMADSYIYPLPQYRVVRTTIT